MLIMSLNYKISHDIFDTILIMPGFPGLMYFSDMNILPLSGIFLHIFLLIAANAGPVILKGAMIKELCGTPLNRIRLCDGEKTPIPFQIDELTINGNYICPEGSESNSDSSNGVLDERDEIVFLSDDCSEISGDTIISANTKYHPVYIQNRKMVYITNDSSVPLSSTKYITFDNSLQIVKTPYFYAQFAKDRFHFVRAGVFSEKTGRYVDFAGELGIVIFMKALWGLIPVKYTEDNLVCIVKKYKVGAVRLIRGGDFHLNLGLGLKGSNAYVNQICYPDIVMVPVYVHAPVRFGSFFGEAYVEMTPMVKKSMNREFRVVQTQFTVNLEKSKALDTLIEVNPNKRSMVVVDENNGYGWTLMAKIENKYLKHSGFVFRNPSLRDPNGADCGFRLMIRDLPKGYYEITNWVYFSRKGNTKLETISHWIKQPVTVTTPGGSFRNELLRQPNAPVHSKNGR